VKRTLESRLQEVFTTVIHVAAPEPTADLVDGGLLDSLALVELLAAVESEFGIEIPLEELELDRIRTLERLADLVTERTAIAATHAA
jgi:D-alanine--poly(phosphoribitol) ligase subunit 2